MRRYFIMLACCLCAVSGFAQRGNLLKEWLGLFNRQAATNAVTKTAAKRTIPHEIRFAKIDRLPGTPLVQVRVPSSISLGEILPARVLPPSQVYRSVSLGQRSNFYVPSAFDPSERAVYRGIRIKKLTDLENLLRKGMEIRKSSFPQIYAAHTPGIALDYALLQEEWAIYENIHDIELELPVVVRIPITPKLLSNNPFHNDATEVTFSRSVRADMIPDVMVFLEINGKADWYKAVLENNKLVLISTPTAYVSWIDFLW